MTVFPLATSLYIYISYANKSCLGIFIFPFSLVSPVMNIVSMVNRLSSWWTSKYVFLCDELYKRHYHA